MTPHTLIHMEKNGVFKENGQNHRYTPYMAVLRNPPLTGGFISGGVTGGYCPPPQEVTGQLPSATS